MEEYVSYPATDSPKIVSVNWVNHSAHIMKQLRLFFGPGGMYDYDVKVACDGGTVNCNQILLALGSHYFAKIFEERLCDQKTTVLLPVLSAKIFRYIYQYILNGTISLPLVEVNAFIKAGQELQVDGLMGFAPKSYTAVSAYQVSTGIANTSLKTSSNVAATLLNVSPKGSNGKTKSVNRETQLMSTTSASGEVQVESMSKSQFDMEIANFRCSGDRIDSNVQPSGVEKANNETFVQTDQICFDHEFGSDDGNSGVHFGIPMNQIEENCNCQGPKRTGIIVNDRMLQYEEKDQQEENKINIAEHKSCDKGTENELRGKETETESCGKDIGNESYRKKSEKELNEKGRENEFCGQSAANESSAQKSNHDDGENVTVPCDNVDEDKELSSSENDKRHDSDSKTNRSEQYRKRKYEDDESYPQRSKFLKQGRKGIILHQGKTYTIKQAKEIGVSCPDCYRLVRLSNLKNHTLKNCKGNQSFKKVLEKMNCDFHDCEFSFSDPVEFKKHMESHDIKFLCTLCGRKFMMKDNFDMHQKDCKKTTSGIGNTFMENQENSEVSSSEED